ncbi:MAG: endonuclease Q family protein [Candidatus Omnitrophica bacterium]|nr:endonuclease Q family protein [Candidatus Omnitrophota bacterium]
MGQFIADFHIHSRYSRATSPDMGVKNITAWAATKGIAVVGTGDFTHPLWRKELKKNLGRHTNGLYEYDKVKFILTAEISNIYKKNGKGRRVHTILFVPDFKTADRVSKELEKRGNISSDGRPIFGFDAKDLVKIALDASPQAMIVPAHVWTPWFSVLGSMSGFDSIEECFEEQSENIYALETGLSASPDMCWRVSSLDKYSLISNSDSHSPGKIGREANVFDTGLGYEHILSALKEKDSKRFLYTIEFFPQEGKYHYDGHRSCGVCYSPSQTRMCAGICPVCGKKLTIGVMSRVEALSDRPENFMPKDAIPFRRLVPLLELIAATQKKGICSKTVISEYKAAINFFGSEFNALLFADSSVLYKGLSCKTADAVLNVRQGNVGVRAGYDGVYGTIDLNPASVKRTDYACGGNHAKVAD